MEKNQVIKFHFLSFYLDAARAISETISDKTNDEKPIEHPKEAHQTEKSKSLG